MAACMLWKNPVVAANSQIHIPHSGVRRKQIAASIAINQKSPAAPSKIRPKALFCPVIRANCPSALSYEFAQINSNMPITLIARLWK